MVLCAYVDMLNLEDRMKGHRFFRQAAELAIEVRVMKSFPGEEKKTKVFHLDLHSSA